MKFEEFINLWGDLPIIDTANLLSDGKQAPAMKVQITRWQKAGRIIQLRRGIYVLAETFRKVEPYGPYIASILKKPSYVSLEKALEFHGLIPDAVPVYTSVTTKRPGVFISVVGRFTYRHIKKSLFWGYASVTVKKQTAFIAVPEKALLDLIYLNNAKVSFEYLKELRLQNVEKFNLPTFMSYATKFHKPCIKRAAKFIKKYIEQTKREEKNV